MAPVGTPECLFVVVALTLVGIVSVSLWEIVANFVLASAVRVACFVVAVALALVGVVSLALCECARILALVFGVPVVFLLLLGDNLDKVTWREESFVEPRKILNLQHDGSIRNTRKTLRKLSLLIFGEPQLPADRCSAVVSVGSPFAEQASRRAPILAGLVAEDPDEPKLALIYRDLHTKVIAAQFQRGHGVLTATHLMHAGLPSVICMALMGEASIAAAATERAFDALREQHPSFELLEWVEIWDRPARCFHYYAFPKKPDVENDEKAGATQAQEAPPLQEDSEEGEENGGGESSGESVPSSVIA